MPVDEANIEAKWTLLAAKCDQLKIKHDAATSALNELRAIKKRPIQQRGQGGQMETVLRDPVDRDLRKIMSPQRRQEIYDDVMAKVDAILNS